MSAEDTQTPAWRGTAGGIPVAAAMIALLALTRGGGFPILPGLAGAFLVWLVLCAAGAVTTLGAKAIVWYFLQRRREALLPHLVASFLIWLWPAQLLAKALLAGTRAGADASPLVTWGLGGALSVAVIALIFLARHGLGARRATRGAGVLGLMAAGAAFFVNQDVLVAQYPLWHAALAVMGLALALVATRLVVATSLPVAMVAIVLGLGLGTQFVSLEGRGFDSARRVLDLRDRGLRVIRPPEFELEADTDILAGRWGHVVSGRREELFAGRTPPTNVLFITIDALRSDRVTHLGYHRPTTPFLDELANESVVFERAYAQGSNSLSSIMSMFTGRYPSTLNVWRAREGRLPVEEQTLAESLRDVGYYTVGAPAYWRDLVESSFKDFKRGFERFDLHPEKGYRKAEDGRQLGLDILRGCKNRKHFAWLHFLEPHRPYPPYFDRFGTSPSDQYDHAVRVVDDSLRRFWTEARRDGLLDDTLVILHSDHGEEFGEHGGYYHGSTVYEEQVRVPLMIWYTGGPARRVKSPVELVDVVPTVFDILGLEPPLPMHGDSLIPELLGEPGSGFAITEVIPLLEAALGRRITAVVDGPLKAIRDNETGRLEVYDLEANPTESSDAPPFPRGTEESMARMTAAAHRLVQTLPDIGAPPIPEGNGEIFVPVASHDIASIRAGLWGDDVETAAKALRTIMSGAIEPWEGEIERRLRQGGNDLAEVYRREIVRRKLRRAEPVLWRLITEGPEENRAQFLDAYGECARPEEMTWLDEWCAERGPEWEIRADLARARAGDPTALRRTHGRFLRMKPALFEDAWRALARDRDGAARHALIASILAAPFSQFTWQSMITLGNGEDPSSLPLYVHLRGRYPGRLLAYDSFSVSRLSQRLGDDVSKTGLHEIYCSSTSANRVFAAYKLEELGRNESIGDLGAVLDHIEARPALDALDDDVTFALLPGSMVMPRVAGHPPLLSLRLKLKGKSGPEADRVFPITLRVLEKNVEPREISGWLLMEARGKAVFGCSTGAALAPGRRLELVHAGKTRLALTTDALLRQRTLQ